MIFNINYSNGDISTLLRTIVSVKQISNTAAFKTILLERYAGNIGNF